MISLGQGRARTRPFQPKFHIPLETASFESLSLYPQMNPLFTELEP